MSVRVPLAILHLPKQKYSCHGCGDCCRDFTVQLRPKDIERLEAQGYARDLGEAVTVEFRGAHYLRQKSDGACYFLEDDGRCRIHADHGFDEKPVACRLFPFNLAPDARGPSAGLNFACQSVQRNAGAGLDTHARDLKRALRELPEVDTQMPPRLSGRLRADTEEVNAITSGIDSWLTSEVPPVHGNFGEKLPVVHRWPYDFSVPGSKEDFIPQTTPPSEVLDTEVEKT